MGIRPEITNMKAIKQNEVNIIHCFEVTNGDIDIKVQNGVRLYGKLQEYPIAVKKKFGEYYYPEKGMFSPNRWLTEKEKEYLTNYLEDRFNITIEN